jgi:glycosyltransferase involved in cell wall biosynthesis
MTAQPLFCFVVPCFNEEDNVEATVNSIRAAVGKQTYYEIILVNDCSHDRTLQRMQALANSAAGSPSLTIQSI